MSARRAKMPLRLLLALVPRRDRFRVRSRRPGEGGRESTSGDRRRLRSRAGRPRHAHCRRRHRVHRSRRHLGDGPDQYPPAGGHRCPGRSRRRPQGHQHHRRQPAAAVRHRWRGHHRVSRQPTRSGSRIHPAGTASRLLAVIVGTGGDATRINSVSYSIADDSQLVKDARAHAFQDAKDRAAQYAQLSGLGLGKVISISEASGGAGPPTMPAPMRGGMASAVPLEPGQQTVSFSVTAVWELR